MAWDGTGREAVVVETPDGRPPGASWEDGLEPILVRPVGRRPLSLRETLHREASPPVRRPSTSTMRLLCAAVWLLSGVGTATAAWSVRQTMFPTTDDPAPASVWQNASTSDRPQYEDDLGAVAGPETRPIAVRPEDRYEHDEAEVGDDSSGPDDDQAVADSGGPSGSSGPGPGPTTVPEADDSSGPGPGPTTVPEADDSSGPGPGDAEADSGSSGSGRGGSGTDGPGTGASPDSSGSGSSGSGSGSSGSGSDDEEP
jgi:uncharacterized membrane protein YgcG